mgnify:FL=1
MYVCMYVCMYVNIHTNIHVYVYVTCVSYIGLSCVDWTTMVVDYHQYMTIGVAPILYMYVRKVDKQICYHAFLAKKEKCGPFTCLCVSVCIVIRNKCVCVCVRA